MSTIPSLGANYGACSRYSTSQSQLNAPVRTVSLANPLPGIGFRSINQEFSDQGNGQGSNPQAARLSSGDSPILPNSINDGEQPSSTPESILSTQTQPASNGFSSVIRTPIARSEPNSDRENRCRNIASATLCLTGIAAIGVGVGVSSHSCPGGCLIATGALGSMLGWSIKCMQWNDSLPAPESEPIMQ